METSEDVFIKDWKMFYDNDHSVVNDVSEKRIRRLLEQYKNKIEPEKEIIIVEKIVEVHKQIHRIGNTVISSDMKQSMINLANDICIKYDLDYKLFMKEQRKIKNSVRVARTDFCRTALDLFKINQEYLSDFFNVHHTSICYYLRPYSKFKHKKNVA